MAKVVSTNWRDRIIRNYGLGIYAHYIHMDNRIPKWLVGRPLAVFFVSFLLCFAVLGHTPNPEFMLDSVILIIIFLYGGYECSRRWTHVSEKRYLKNVLWAGILVRLVWVLYMYFLFNPKYYGTRYGDGADVTWYMPFGEGIAEWIKGNNPMSFEELRIYWGSSLDDVGYPFWLAIVYLFTGGVSDVFIPMIVKTFVGGYCAISIYNIAKRHFGEATARLAALFVALSPNMIYWCASMMKEAEMMFLCCFSIDRIDKAVSSGNKLTFKSLLPGVLAGLYLFFFRMALGLTVFMALFAHIVFVSDRVMGIGKKVVAGVLVAIMLGIGIGDRLITQSERLLQSAQSEGQNVNMEWRSKRQGGNSFARYAGAAVFAPLIFTIPFPTFNAANEHHILQIQLSGGNYLKNILSFFVVLVFLLMLASGEWRRHVFILAYTIGYLLVLVLSNFAQSGRFHMPVFPMLMLFAAYGVQIAKGNVSLRKGFNIFLFVEIVICLGWNWFKLKGRGMV